MKKHWKKILLSLVIVLVAAGGYVLYLFQFKEYETADEEVEKITKETYKVELPDGTTLEFDEKGDIKEFNNVDGSTTDKVDSTLNSVTAHAETNDKGNSNDSTSTESDQATEKTSHSSSPGKGSNNSKQPSNSEKATVASIKEKYSPVMSSLQQQADAKINALASRALTEYKQKKANGESVDYAYFYNKYTAAASELESQTDSVFYNVVSIFEKELEKNGYSKSHAKSFIDQYEQAKEERRDSLLKKAMNR